MLPLHYSISGENSESKNSYIINMLHKLRYILLSQGLRMVIFRTIAFSQIGFVLLFGSNRLTQNFILSQYIYNKLSQLERSFIHCELAESFGMMMVKVEAREFRLKQIIEELEDTKARLKEDADGVREG
jgi:hypothetical protein